jgi:heme exporter protein A
VSGPPAERAEGVPALVARGLTKQYGPIRAVDGVDLAIPAGQSVALLGPNGAGKTTLLRLLATLVRPTTGGVLIHGRDPARGDAAPLRRRIGLLSHRTFLYDHLTGLENLVFYARLYGLAGAPAAARQALHGAGLDARGDDLVRTYSRGMQQRLAIARALLHRPDILLLDEPFTGLDREAADRLHATLSRARRDGLTCVMATHDLGAGLPHADRIVVLLAGRAVADREARGLALPEVEALIMRTTGARPPAAENP